MEEYTALDSPSYYLSMTVGATQAFVLEGSAWSPCNSRGCVHRCVPFLGAVRSPRAGGDERGGTLEDMYALEHNPRIPAQP